MFRALAHIEHECGIDQILRQVGPHLRHGGLQQHSSRYELDLVAETFGCCRLIIVLCSARHIV
jgi:hypothetical protein